MIELTHGEVLHQGSPILRHGGEETPKRTRALNNTGSNHTLAGNAQEPKHRTRTHYAFVLENRAFPGQKHTKTGKGETAIPDKNQG